MQFACSLGETFIWYSRIRSVAILLRGLNAISEEKRLLAKNEKREGDASRQLRERPLRHPLVAPSTKPSTKGLTLVRVFFLLFLEMVFLAMVPPSLMEDCGT
jgi:hypothetical protein